MKLETLSAVKTTEIEKLEIARKRNPIYFRHSSRWFRGDEVTMAVAMRHRIWQKDPKANPSKNFSNAGHRIKDANGRNWTIPNNDSFDAFYDLCETAHDHHAGLT